MKDIKFEQIVDNISENLNKFFSELTNSEHIKRKYIKNINGIYVFYENEEPIYVGRSNKNRMRKRIQEHSRESSNKNTASFAFLIFNENKKKKLKTIEPKNKEFVNAKNRVFKMNIKIIEINDPIIQTILEPYIAYKLGTTLKYNKFTTH